MTTLQLQGEVQQNRTKNSRKICSSSQQNVPRERTKRRIFQSRHEHCSSDFLSNLEFSSHPQAKNVPKVSLSSIDANNITPQKVPIEVRNKRIPLKQAPQLTINLPSQINIQQGNKINEQTNSTSSKISNSLFLYKVWPSKNSFYFKGRIMTGPKADITPNLIGWLFILVPSLIYYGLVFKYILKDVTLIMPFLSTYLFLCTVIFLILTSFTEPGIIPRKSIWEINGEIPFPYNGNQALFESKNGQITLNASCNKSLSSQNPLSFCQICQIYKPKKTVHCNYCGNCVEIFHRHCHFLRNCIGKRNYKYFVGFLVSSTLLGICYLGDFLMMVIILTGCDPDVDPSYLFKTNTVTLIVVIVLGVPSAIMLLTIIVFIFYHVKIILRYFICFFK